MVEKIPVSSFASNKILHAPKTGMCVEEVSPSLCNTLQLVEIVATPMENMGALIDFIYVKDVRAEFAIPRRAISASA